MKSHLKGYDNSTSPTNFLWQTDEEVEEDEENDE